MVSFKQQKQLNGRNHHITININTECQLTLCCSFLILESYLCFTYISEWAFIQWNFFLTDKSMSFLAQNIYIYNHHSSVLQIHQHFETILSQNFKKCLKILSHFVTKWSLLISTNTFIVIHEETEAISISRVGE
jgi:hypothetical protein